MLLLPSCLSVGALALAASALLIPEGLEDFSVKGFAHPAVSQQQDGKSITLDCSSCPYALKTERNGQHEWIKGVASNLEMDITSDSNTLRFNGVTFYPIQASGPPPPTLQVSQKKKEGGMSANEGYQGDLRLSYSLEYDEKKFEDGNSLVTVLMTVLGLDGEMIKVDNVEIKAIKDAEGKLTIYSAVPVPANPDSPDAKCGNILCRVFTKLLTSINRAKASAKNPGHRVKCFCVKCFQRLAGHAHTMRPNLAKGPETHRRPDGTLELPTHFKFHPQGERHHHKGFFYRMVHTLWITAKIAFVPILIGVAFGIAASAIGMLVGQVVVFLWMKYRKTDELAVYEPLEADEKEVPPPYEDVPGAGFRNEKEVDTKA
ncbi:MAG: hypothetical protein Q9217_001244 [Psora testacea]